MNLERMMKVVGGVVGRMVLLVAVDGDVADDVVGR